MLGVYGGSTTPGGAGDLNWDGRIDARDLGRLLRRVGDSVPPRLAGASGGGVTALNTGCITGLLQTDGCPDDSGHADGSVDGGSTDGGGGGISTGGGGLTDDPNGTDDDDGGGGNNNGPPPPPPPPPCEFTIEGPAFIAAGESAQYTLSIGGADEVEWMLAPAQGVVQVDSPTLTGLTLDVTALQTPGTVTLAAVATVDGETCMDELEVAVGEVDMVAHRPQTEFFNFQAHTIPDGDEENPGAGIRLNGDDDDSNGTPDFDDFVAPNDQIAEEGAVDNDLLKVDLTLEPYPRPSGVQYFLTRSTSAIKVWTESEIVLNNTDDEELVFGPSADPTVLWVEAAEPGASVLTLEVRDEDTGDVLASDSIRFFTFSSTVIVLTGEDLTGSGWGHGTTQIAERLYQDGYDVHLHSEESSVTRAGDPSGEEPAREEIISAVEDRDVSEAAMIGYSHGGGSLYDLSAGLAQSPPAASFTLEFTAYIDAIEDDSDADTDSETRLPVNTQFHMNLWQPTLTAVGPLYGVHPIFDGLVGVHGMPVPGSHVDIDVTAPLPGGLGLPVDHGDIDDAVAVQNLIITELMNHVQR